MATIVNTKAYFIARNAVMLTSKVDKEKVKNSLMASSKIAPNAPIAALIVNKERGFKASGDAFMNSGKKDKKVTKGAGLYGDKMKTAIEKLIRIRQRTVNYLRSGWVPAVKQIERMVPKKGGRPKMDNIKPKGKDKGGGSPAPSSGGWKVSATIWNSVFGFTKTHGLKKRNKPSEVVAILEKGMQKAIDKEVASMKEYVEKKLAESAKIMNR